MTKVGVEQIDVDQIPSSENSQDSPSDDFTISLHVPENIEIQMVDSTYLGQYEIWFSSAAVILSVFAGFMVAWIQDTNPATKPVFFSVSLIFAAIFVFCFVMTITSRRALRKKRKVVKLYTSRVVES